jgi:hypothetical protein
MKVSQNFILQEFIPPDIYAERGDKSIELLDNRIISLAQFFRDYFGSITINNWDSGGQYKESGLRSFTTTIGAKYSQHRFGRGADLKFTGTTPQKAYAEVLKNQKLFYDKGLRVMENISATPSWLHIDVRITSKINQIEIVNP